jgi:hypothetical protein
MFETINFVSLSLAEQIEKSGWNEANDGVNLVSLIPKPVTNSINGQLAYGMRNSGMGYLKNQVTTATSTIYTIGELRSGSRRRVAVKARRAMSLIGVRELGYSGAEVVRYFGVTNSCVTRMISTVRKQDTDDINLNL